MLNICFPKALKLLCSFHIKLQIGSDKARKRDLKVYLMACANKGVHKLFQYAPFPFIYQSKWIFKYEQWKKYWDQLVPRWQCESTAILCCWIPPGKCLFKECQSSVLHLHVYWICEVIFNEEDKICPVDQWNIATFPEFNYWFLQLLKLQWPILHGFKCKISSI